MSIRAKFRVKGKLMQAMFMLFMSAIALMVLFPLFLTIVLSLKTNADFAAGFWSFPKSPVWSNYTQGFGGIILNMVNSIVVCSIISIGVVFIGVFVAYVFARHNFPLKNFFFAAIIALMAVPGILTLTPQYLITINLHLDNTWLALILPAVSSGQVASIFLFRTFMSSHPAELYESAAIEGANDFIICFKIAMPLTIPILILRFLEVFGLQYNDYLWPLLVINNKSIQVLMPLLKELTDSLRSSTNQQGIPYAMYILSGLPLVACTLVGLKFFINGDFASGLKM